MASMATPQLDCKGTFARRGKAEHRATSEVKPSNALSEILERREGVLTIKCSADKHEGDSLPWAVPCEYCIRKLMPTPVNRRLLVRNLYRTENSRTGDIADEHSYLRVLFGRTWHFPDVLASEFHLSDHALRIRSILDRCRLSCDFDVNLGISSEHLYERIHSL